MTNLMPKPVLVGSRSHGEPFSPETFSIPRWADPPSASGGVALGADDTAISSGGVAGGFTLSDDLDRLQRIYQFLDQAYKCEWHLPASVITSLVGASPVGVQWKAYGFEFFPASKHRDEVAWSVAPASWDFDRFDGKPLRRDA